MDTNKRVSIVPGYVESTEIRNETAGADLKAYFKSKIETGFTQPMVFSDEKIDSLTDYDSPVTVQYSMKTGPVTEDVFYFNPILSGALRANPFAAQTRYNPVELPYTKSEIFVLNMRVPEGYRVEELPKSARARLNDSDGLFEYLVQESDGQISLRTVLQFNKTYFDPSEYDQVREFYSLIMKKQAQPIVLKKIK